MKIQLIRHDDTIHENTRLPKSLNVRQGLLPPLGLAYIASALEKTGHEVLLTDVQALRLSLQDIRQQIRKFNPQIVGLSATTPTIQTTLNLAKAIKEEGKTIVLGGPHLSLFPQETLSMDCVDYGVIGEGEETIVELCAALEAGNPVQDIRGLASKHNGQIIVQPPRIVDNLNNLTWPSYHLLPMEKYSSIIGLHPVSTIMASRGCPYRCSFCYKSPSDKKIRRRDTTDVVDEMEYLAQRYKLKEIMFYDDMMPEKYAVGLCEEILKRGLDVSWESPQRVDLVNPKTLKLMKRAGCRMLRFGVEQGDPEMMQIIEKKFSISTAKNAFRWTHEAGIETFAYFIIGYLGETPETIKKTIALAKDLNPRYVMFTKAVPLPGTKFHFEAVKGGYIDEDYWLQYSLYGKKGRMKDFVPDSDYWIARAYREFYLRPGKIIDHCLHIRSLRDLKKNIDGFLGICFFQQK